MNKILILALSFLAVGCGTKSDENIEKANLKKVARNSTFCVYSFEYKGQEYLTSYAGGFIRVEK
jgi:hypothetical protein